MGIVSVQITDAQNLPLIHDAKTLKQPKFSSLNDDRWLITKIYHLIVALFKELPFVVHYRKMGAKLENELQRKVFWKFTDPDIKNWAKDSKGAVFFIHGFHGEPQVWSEHLKLIPSNLDTRAFYIPNQGNCSDKVALDGIVEVINDYAAKFPDKPIVIYGFSNGARLLLHLDEQLSINNPIYFKSISGPHYGTKVMNIAKKICCCLRPHPQLEERLPYGNQTALALLKNLREKPLNPKRKYDFYASESDQTIRASFFTNIHLCALPIINKNETHVLVKGVHKAGHHTILTHVRPIQISRMHEWLKNIN